MIERITDNDEAKNLTEWIDRHLGPPGKGPSNIIPTGFDATAQILPTLRHIDGTESNWTHVVGPSDSYEYGTFDEMYGHEHPSWHADTPGLPGDMLEEFMGALLDHNSGRDQPILLWRKSTEESPHAVSTLFRSRLSSLARLPWLDQLAWSSPAECMWAENREWIFRTDIEYGCSWFGGTQDHLKHLTRAGLEIRTRS